MSNVSVGPVSAVQAVPEGPAVGNVVSADERAFNLSVGTAVRQLNEAGIAGEGREVTYSIDPASKQPVIKLIESQTKDVITQWPPKYALALAAEYQDKTKDS